MTVELWYGSKPINQGEQNVLIHLYDHLQAKADHFVLLCNFMPGRGNEIDLMVLKRDGFFLAELKHYWSQIRGGKEGDWCFLDDGSEKSPFYIQQDRIVVGRAPGCDLVINDASVSRLHAEIYRKEGHWVVRDLDSVNHTFVSYGGDPNAEHKIETANAIKNGSLVRFGHIGFTFLWSE